MCWKSIDDAPKGEYDTIIIWRSRGESIDACWCDDAMAFLDIYGNEVHDGLMFTLPPGRQE